MLNLLICLINWFFRSSHAPVKTVNVPFVEPTVRMAYVTPRKRVREVLPSKEDYKQWIANCREYNEWRKNINISR